MVSGIAIKISPELAGKALEPIELAFVVKSLGIEFNRCVARVAACGASTGIFLRGTGVWRRISTKKK